MCIRTLFALACLSACSYAPWQKHAIDAVLVEDTAPVSIPEEPPAEVLAQRDRIAGLFLFEAFEPSRAHALSVAIVDEANAAKLDPMWVIAIIAVESRFKLTSVSHRGASGLMQLMPATRQWMLEREGDLQASSEDDVVRDVRLGIRYYAYLLRAFRTPERALAAYNCGPTRLVDLRKAGEEIPMETRLYPKRVLSAYRRFGEDFTSLHKKPVLAAQ